MSSVYQNDNNVDNYCQTGLCAYRKGSTYKDDYWLSSRAYKKDDELEGFNFRVRSITSSGELDSFCFRSYINNLNWTELNWNNDVRPIITLKSDVKKDTGSGTKESPYTLKQT